MELPSENQIILTTLNARYMHTAFGLRYLYANLGELQNAACIEEFTIQQRPIDIVEKLLKFQAKIIGFGVYIWNVSEVTKTIEILKQVSPETIIVLGGPEVSHLPDKPAVVDIADYIVMGAAEKSFRELCQLILSGNKPLERIIQSDELSLDKIKLPYKYYTDDDIKNRLIYVEASRGCPFKCEFCLSSLDKTSKPFELGLFLDEMDKLFQRGARNFKFIDRTFNLKVSSSVAILEFFLERMTDDLYLHFEVVPDNLPDKLKAIIQKFPYHTLQFEIGVQTFDENIQKLISRKQNNNKTCGNLRWLRENTQAYIHADLIFGLPSDTLDNFAKSFDKLVDLNPHEIQLGILKRLRGVPLNRHNEKYQLCYNPEAPYNILRTRDINFETMQRVNRFARYWDMIANSGRFKNTLPLILADSPFEYFMQLSDALYQAVGSTWKISQQRLFVLIFEILKNNFSVDESILFEAMKLDYDRTGEKAVFESLLNKKNKVTRIGVANKRQQKVLQ
ncbi:Mg-protoporphyrin IX monomethyl ester oxidative cyclase [hydrothermal vent metagenome]|uniref:Mg-protoporphyrin IX monomethyl ester oxidative cyclase n=1 Tax=hydrothermal vent metagenome TaxID=652676 RepID=A0A3B0WCM7_9ZZZZ